MSGDEAAADEAVDFEAEAPEAAETAAAPTAAATEGNGGAEEPATADKTAPTDESAPAATNGTAAAEKKEATDPDDPLSLPPQGSEVFLGGIPKSATEEQVREFAEKAGKVHSVTLVKDPNNPAQNKGYGFVRYFDKETADAAKESLNGNLLGDTKAKVRVSDSKAKHKLHLGGIARVLTKEQLSDELNKIVKGLERCDLVMSKELTGQNKGFAFLTFYNHECAEAAKGIIAKSTFNPGGRALVVSYAEAKEEPDAPPARPNKAVYVGGLPQGATPENLAELFAKYGEVEKVVIPAATERRPEQQFGFVHFKEQASATKAVSEAKAEKPELLEKALEVKAARPQEPRDGPRGAPGGFAGRGGGRYPPGRGGYPPQGGRGRGRQQYSGYDQGYDQGYGGYDQGYGGYDQGGYDQGAYGAYGGAVPVAAAAASPAGMTMVPMMLPSGQVGYVLQSADGGAPAADYGSYGASGPDRSYGGRGSRGRGRGGRRYAPY